MWKDDLSVQQQHLLLPLLLLLFLCVLLLLLFLLLLFLLLLLQFLLLRFLSVHKVILFRLKGFCSHDGARDRLRFSDEAWTEKLLSCSQITSE